MTYPKYQITNTLAVPRRLLQKCCDSLPPIKYGRWAIRENWVFSRRETTRRLYTGDTQEKVLHADLFLEGIYGDPLRAVRGTQ